LYHGSELINFELSTILTDSPLLKKNRTFRIEFNQKGYDEENGGDKN
jgi:hypothetical protein